MTIGERLMSLFNRADKNNYTVKDVFGEIYARNVSFISAYFIVKQVIIDLHIPASLILVVKEDKQK